MLYTKKGDNGTTKLFDCPRDVRMSKASFVFETLGTIDELNSSIGYAKSLCQKYGLVLGTRVGRVSYQEILENFQQKDGSVKIPEALQKYTGFSEILPKKS